MIFPYSHGLQILQPSCSNHSLTCPVSSDVEPLGGMKGATLHLLPPSKLREGPHGLLLVQGLVTADGSHKKKHPGYRPWTSMGEQDDGIL